MKEENREAEGIPREGVPPTSNATMSQMTNEAKKVPLSEEGEFSTAFAKIAETARSRRADSMNSALDIDETPRPEVVIGSRRYREEAAEFWNCIQGDNDPPDVFLSFTYDHEIVTVSKDGRVRMVSREGLIQRGELSMDFVRVKQRADGKVERILTRPTSQDAGHWMEFSEIPLPRLRGVRRLPFYSKDARLVSSDGFDPRSGLYLRSTLPGFEAPEAGPNDATVEAAKATIREISADFPFQDDWSRANTYGLMLTPLVRELIDGPTPLHVIEGISPHDETLGPGVGKGLLISVATRIATGEHPTLLHYNENKNMEAEMRMCISTALKGLPSVVLMDNIRGGHTIDSQNLARALTAGEWSDRLSKAHNTFSVPVRNLWIATVNNPSYSKEIARRVVPIRLVARSDNPAEGRTFRHPDLLSWVEENRGALFRALCVLVNNWIAKGKPAGSAVLGSFESYSKVVGGILEAAGIPGFLKNVDGNRVAEAHDLSELAAFFRPWFDGFGSKACNAGELLPLLDDATLLPSLPRSPVSATVATRLGGLLSKYDGISLRGFQLTRSWNNSTQSNAYCLVRVQTGSEGGSGV